MLYKHDRRRELCRAATETSIATCCACACSPTLFQWSMSIEFEMIMELLDLRITIDVALFWNKPFNLPLFDSNVEDRMIILSHWCMRRGLHVNFNLFILHLVSTFRLLPCHGDVSSSLRSLWWRPSCCDLVVFSCIQNCGTFRMSIFTST